MDSRDLNDKFKRWRDIKYYFPYSELSGSPNWCTAILTCMDCRITTNVFGIEDPGEAIIIRNAGALLTFDSFRSLLISVYELNVDKIIVVGHTDCGVCMTTSRMETVLSNISKRINRKSKDILSIMGVENVNEIFLGFSNVKVQIRQTVESIREHPLISDAGVEVIGYIYNTKTGELLKLSSMEF